MVLTRLSSLSYVRVLFRINIWTKIAIAKCTVSFPLFVPAFHLPPAQFTEILNTSGLLKKRKRLKVVLNLTSGKWRQMGLNWRRFLFVAAQFSYTLAYSLLRPDLYCMCALQRSVLSLYISPICHGSYFRPVIQTSRHFPCLNRSAKWFVSHRNSCVWVVTGTGGRLVFLFVCMCEDMWLSMQSTHCSYLNY